MWEKGQKLGAEKLDVVEKRDRFAGVREDLAEPGRIVEDATRYEKGDV